MPEGPAGGPRPGAKPRVTVIIKSEDIQTREGDPDILGEMAAESLFLENIFPDAKHDKTTVTSDEIRIELKYNVITSMSGKMVLSADGLNDLKKGLDDRLNINIEQLLVEVK